MRKLIDSCMAKLGYVRADSVRSKPIIISKQPDVLTPDFSKEIGEFESYIYMCENHLYTFEKRTGRIWSLRGGDYAGEYGTPLPEYIEGIGKLTFLGIFRLSD